MVILNRVNNIEIRNNKKVLEFLNENNINYFSNIIFGIPNQTLNSLKNTIKFLKTFSNNKVFAYP